MSNRILSPSIDDKDNAIFKAICEEDRLLAEMKTDIYSGVPIPLESGNTQTIFTRKDLATIINRQVALKHTTGLLSQAGQCYEEWDSKATRDKYMIYYKHWLYRDLHMIQKSLIAHCISKELKQAKLRTLVCGHEDSKRFVYNLNPHFKAIAKDIMEYNDIAQKLAVNC